MHMLLWSADDVEACLERPRIKVEPWEALLSELPVRLWVRNLNFFLPKLENEKKDIISLENHLGSFMWLYEIVVSVEFYNEQGTIRTFS